MDLKDDNREFASIIEENKGVFFYFSTMSCSVGEALEPKVRLLLSEKFPKLLFCMVDMNSNPEILVMHQVVVEPTILLFLEGKEFLRKSRNFSLLDLEVSISRVYKLAFE